MMNRYLQASLGVVLATLVLGPLAYATGTYIGAQDDTTPDVARQFLLGAGGEILIPPPPPPKDPGPYMRPNVTLGVTPLATVDTSSGTTYIGAWDGDAPLVLFPRKWISQR